MSRNKKIVYFLIIIIMLILTPIKLFTVKVEVENDPTVAIATTKRIMLDNYIKIDSEDVLVKDFCEENSFNPIRIDDNWDIWYDKIIIAWWVLLVVSIILIIKGLMGRKKDKVSSTR